MLTRVVAAVLVLTLTGPSVATAACELTCVLASHHHGQTSSSAASCHEHQGSQQGVSARQSSLCHESGDLPFAVVDAWLSAIPVSTVPAATVVIAPPITTRTIAPAYARRAPFDLRPAHRPLRV